MSRKQTVSARDVEKAYSRAKDLMPGLGTLKRDEIFKSWWVGQIIIGFTAREAKAFLLGMIMGVQWAGLAGAA